MDKKKLPPKKNTLVVLIVVAVAIAITAALLIHFLPSSNGLERISYTEFVQHLERGEVDRVFYNESEDYMTVILFNDETRNMTEAQREIYDYSNVRRFEVIYPEGDDFKETLLLQGVIAKKSSQNVGSIINTVASFSLYFIFIAGMLIIMQKASPLSNTSYVRAVHADELDVSFDDVIGLEEIKGDLKLLVKQLKNGAKAKDLSHGVLFEGSAGTGKTMLAKAIAHEAGVNFISVSSSSFVEMYVGLGARRVRDTFKKAREAAPCVLFFDEIDAVGAKRGSQRSHRENDQTINALLTELDGFDEKGDILVIAATNRADDLDEALLRSGRFDRRVRINAPKRWETRQELFDHYLNDKADETVNTEVLAKQTVGFSGADIASVCREARIIAFREDEEKVSHAFLEEAIDKMVFKGNRSNDAQHAEDLECVAYHEAGHAVMTYLVNRHISRISIFGMTSGVGGAVFQADNERAFETKKQVEEQIMVAYAGRASEEIHFGEENVTQGATNDITQATQLLCNYATKFGFDDELGLIDVETLSNGVMITDNLTTRLSKLSKRFYERASSKLRDNYRLVERLAQKLLEARTLSGKEAEEVLLNADKEIL